MIQGKKDGEESMEQRSGLQVEVQMKKDGESCEWRGSGFIWKKWEPLTKGLRPNLGGKAE